MPLNPEDLGFQEPHIVIGKTSIADIFPIGHRCGIYLLEFSNGEFYCGQAKDVTRRYVQHCKTHRDISAIRFFEVDQHDLNEIEEHCIHSLESEGYLLRNIIFVSVVNGETNFNQIMSLQNQRIWLIDRDYVDLDGERYQDENLRRRYHNRYLRLMEQPKINFVLSILRTYAQNFIPAVRRAEYHFWACSCLPYFQIKDFKTYSRFNINQQEVFSVFYDVGKKQLQFAFQMAKSIVEEGGMWEQVKRKHQIHHLHKINFQYQPGGQDQLRFEIEGEDDIEKFLEDPTIRKSIRTFNLRLMRKGPCLNKMNHCLDLADHLVD